jgi:hypothetical protein
MADRPIDISEYSNFFYPNVVGDSTGDIFIESGDSIPISLRKYLESSLPLAPLKLHKGQEQT